MHLFICFGSFCSVRKHNEYYWIECQVRIRSLICGHEIIIDFSAREVAVEPQHLFLIITLLIVIVCTEAIVLVEYLPLQLGFLLLELSYWIHLSCVRNEVAYVCGMPYLSHGQSREEFYISETISSFRPSCFDLESLSNIFYTKCRSDNLIII